MKTFVKFLETYQIGEITTVVKTIPKRINELRQSIENLRKTGVSQQTLAPLHSLVNNLEQQWDHTELKAIRDIEQSVVKDL